MRPRLLLVLTALIFALSACAGPPRVDPRFAQALEAPYRLDSGDRLRVVVFGQETLSNAYAVDPSGYISVPLIGPVAARGLTVRQLEASVTAALRSGYVRDPSVSVQVEAYRPFFILGEVRDPGQYAYVSGLTAKTAVAIAGGFSPRAVQGQVAVSRQIDGVTVDSRVPLDHPIMPGDTVHVLERWF